MRIALFTPFSPEIGGGSVQLRSHLRQMSGLEVDWFYLAKAPVSGERRHWLGEPFSPAELLSDLSARSGCLPGSTARAGNLIDEMPADLHWIVGHYEGICVAAELAKRGGKFHLTVHDDPFGTWMRSGRFRLFRPLLRRTFPRVLRAAQGIDVTSWGMRNLYRRKYGVKCFALYRHVAELSPSEAPRDPARLTVGHIGTLYQAEPFRRFVAACKKVAGEGKQTLRIVRIGSSPEMDAVAAREPSLFETHPELDEERAIPLLAGCDFLYAMYPPGKKFALFRQTSLPIKVSTYLQAGRSIFAHTPGDSNLACIVAKYGVGRVCDELSEDKLAGEIQALLQQPLRSEDLERVRKELMGEEQVRQLGAALRGEDWQSYPEFDC